MKSFLPFYSSRIYRWCNYWALRWRCSGQANSTGCWTGWTSSSKSFPIWLGLKMELPTTMRASTFSSSSTTFKAIRPRFWCFVLTRRWEMRTHRKERSIKNGFIRYPIRPRILKITRYSNDSPIFLIFEFNSLEKYECISSWLSGLILARILSIENNWPLFIKVFFVSMNVSWVRWYFEWIFVSFLFFTSIFFQPQPYLTEGINTIL